MCVLPSLLRGRDGGDAQALGHTPADSLHGKPCCRSGAQSDDHAVFNLGHRRLGSLHFQLIAIEVVIHGVPSFRALTLGPELKPCFEVSSDRSDHPNSSPIISARRALGATEIHDLTKAATG